MKNKIAVFCTLFLLLSGVFIQPVLWAKSRGGSSGGFQRRSTPSFPSSGGGHSYGGGSYSGGGGSGLFLLPFLASGGGGGGGLIPLLVVGGIGFLILRAVVASKKRKKAVDSGFSESEQGTLVNIQVGLYYGKGELEKELIQISERVDTGNHSGLVTLLREVSMVVKRNWESLRWYHFLKENCDTQDQLEARFREVVSSERMKLDEEEFTDTDGMEINRKTQKDNLEEIIVLNITLASASDLLIPKGISPDNLEKLVHFMASLPDSQVMGANVVWNITDRDSLIEHFPEMRSI